MAFARAARLAVATIATGLLLPLAASAQQAGIYTGMASTGPTMTITVGLDANTGQYQLTEFDGAITENCMKGDNAQAWRVGASSRTTIRNRPSRARDAPPVKR